MVIVLGLGFTGQRLARRLLQAGVPVCAAVRGIERFRDLADMGLVLIELTPETAKSLPTNALVAHLIPPVASLRPFIEEIEPRRIVYVSSTGVYGDQIEVDDQTPAHPGDERGRLRFDEESWIAGGPWSSLILRAAAIYGPGRGVHAAVREGRIPRGGVSGVVSRIHVDDLVALIHGGLFSNLEGTFPVADDEPCSSAEIIAWCAQLWKMEEIQASNNAPAAGRRVDGTKIREKLGVELAYRSWKTGIPQSLAEEEVELTRRQQRPKVH
jgi:nucleoside-diphosphate-sugar epimerase